MLQWIVSSSILILIVIGLRYLLKGKIRPMVQYGLWVLVLVRLLVPFQIGRTAISFQNTLEKAPVVQQLELAERVDHFVYHEDGSASGYYEPAPEDNTPSPAPQTFTQQEAEKITHLRTAKEWLTLIWIVGMAGMTLTFALSNCIFFGKLRKTRRFLEKQALPVYETKEVQTPCLFGLFRPTVYLTPETAADPRLRYYTVTHETTHYRHWDMVWSVLRCLCLILHWYNPLVWWAAILSRADGELACDEATIAALGEDRRTDYGRALIDLTCIKPSDLLHTATMMTGSARDLKERITRIAKKPKMAFYTLLIVILIAAIAVGCTFTGGKDKPEETPPAEETVDPTTEPTTEPLPTETTVLPPPVAEWKQDSLLDPDEPIYCGIAAGLRGGFYTSPTQMHVISYLSAPIFTDVCVVADETQAPKQAVSLNGTGTLRKITTADLNTLLRKNFGITIDQTESSAKSDMYYHATEDVYYFREVSAYDGAIGLDGVLLGDDRVTQYAVYRTEECWVRVILKQTKTGNIITACERAKNNIMSEPGENVEGVVLYWKLPNYPQLSYDDYFSKTRYYYYPDQGESPAQQFYWGGWHARQDKCEVRMEDGKIFAGPSLNGEYVQVGTETHENTSIVCCDEFWIYAIKDRKELFRIDYAGKNRQTLYVDETEKIMASERNTHVRENSVLFFTAAAGSDYGIYRLYLHDMTLDLLYTTESRPTLYDPYSNFEISWSSPVKKVVNDVYEIDYYYSCATGILLERPVIGDRSWGNTTWPWWEDDLTAEFYGLPGNAMDSDERAWFKKLFAMVTPEGNTNWYNTLLAVGRPYLSSYTNPAEIDLYHLFDTGFQQYGVEITEEEEIFLGIDKENPGGDIKKRPVKLMNQILLDYTGYTLDQTEGRGLERLRYYEPTDSYFGGTNSYISAENYEMICGTREEDGTVHLVCKANGYYLRLKLLPKEGDPDIPYYVYSCYEITPRT